MYLYNAPSLFYGLWAIVRPFVDPVTREKVVFVYKREDFTKYFDPKVGGRLGGWLGSLVSSVT